MHGVGQQKTPPTTVAGNNYKSPTVPPQFFSLFINCEPPCVLLPSSVNFRDLRCCKLESSLFQNLFIEGGIVYIYSYVEKRYNKFNFEKIANPSL